MALMDALPTSVEAEFNVAVYLQGCIHAHIWREQQAAQEEQCPLPALPPQVWMGLAARPSILRKGGSLPDWEVTRGLRSSD